MTNPNPLRVLFISAEADPFVKIGGLGDVAGSLPPALRSLTSFSPAGEAESPAQMDVRLVIPFHGIINRNNFRISRLTSVEVAHTSGPLVAEIYQTDLNGLPVDLIGGDPIPPFAPVYSSDWGFDAHKYIFFSLAALELARKIGWQPHIVHANDWHTAAAVYWLSLHRQDEFFRNTATVLGVHNLPYMGVGASFPLESFFLPPAIGSPLPVWAQHLPLPLGLLSADHIVTVSATYAKEILTPEFGAGLDEFLRSRTDKISGIVNGLDQQRWNPSVDAHISVTYSADSVRVRDANKAALLNEIGFVNQINKALENHIPLLAMISRLDYQKGVDLTVEALNKLASQASKSAPSWRMIFLGTGLPELEQMVRKLEQKYPDRIRSIVRFDAPLSHRIYSGADMLLLPSRYEPCGLAQMIAMRYGCIPVARATGGLNDTITDAIVNKSGTGFLFSEALPEALMRAIYNGLDVYSNQNRWRAMQRRCMQQDFSWEESARRYQRLYYSLIKKGENL